jgi:hypothetical protein
MIPLARQPTMVVSRSSRPSLRWTEWSVRKGGK